MARAAKLTAAKSGTKSKASTKSPIKAVATKLKVTAAEKVVAKPSKLAAPVQSVTKKPAVDANVAGRKSVSQKLLETIARRKQAKAGQKGFFTKPPGRRGRRPKNVEYTPGSNEEETLVYETDERLEYDTGIRVAEKSEDSSLSMERFEEFDEELNFDW